jgi:beta-lactam-binding protein with PASTA domain
VFGLATTVYLSLRSPEVTVPDIVGKDRFDAEHILGAAGLNFRVRATRPSNQVNANTVLFQLPRAGEVVKAGQTVAMDISRSVKEGEAPEAIVVPEPSPEVSPANANEANSNENKPKRNKNTNKNANENGNANNANRANVNINRATNVNRAANANTNAPLNTNRPTLIINGNANRTVTPNTNTRPAVPRPSATVHPN